MSRATAKPLTKQQWDSVLRSVRKSYSDSYAMLVDDAMAGFEGPAKKYGLGAYYDGAVFQFMFAKARYFGDLNDTDYATLRELRKEDS